MALTSDDRNDFSVTPGTRFFSIVVNKTSAGEERTWAENESETESRKNGKEKAKRKEAAKSNHAAVSVY